MFINQSSVNKGLDLNLPLDRLPGISQTGYNEQAEKYEISNVLNCNILVI